MARTFPQLREHVADAITYHPGNRTGTPEQRHPVSLMLADAVLRVVRPCTCDGDPIECSHEAARKQAEDELDKLRAGIDIVVSKSAAAVQDAARATATERDRLTEQARDIETRVHRMFADADERGISLDLLTPAELTQLVMREIRDGEVTTP